MHTIKPNVVNSHHNHVLSDPDAKSVECLTIKVHFAKERPNPAKAPYLQKKLKEGILVFKYLDDQFTSHDYNGPDNKKHEQT